ncbi:hypothetical protein Y1Q_0011417 [Alligator mississippiensis]|uniref:Uncharacterized protein n=1 Tax=Alligator mississippiensis TaxID=8496 RepID=A0A151PJ80_ALLMI|nr:hypothetical protein Y1Q_0011417 [Alligator mississippiensis]
MPATLLDWLGACLQILCCYQACFAPFTATTPRLMQTLVWYHQPHWKPQAWGYHGMELARIGATKQPVVAPGVSFLGNLKGNCSLLIWDVRPANNSTYEVFLSAAHSPRRKVRLKDKQDERWMDTIQVEVTDSAATMGRITAMALGGSLALLIVLGALVLGLRRWRKRQQVPNDIVPVVGGQRSFWVKRKKVRDQEGGARLGFRPLGPLGTPDDALNYSEIRFPPGSHDGPTAASR